MTTWHFLASTTFRVGACQQGFFSQLWSQDWYREDIDISYRKFHGHLVVPSSLSKFQNLYPCFPICKMGKYNIRSKTETKIATDKNIWPENIVVIYFVLIFKPPPPPRSELIMLCFFGGWGRGWWSTIYPMEKIAITQDVDHLYIPEFLWYLMNIPKLFQTFKWKKNAG